MLETLQRESNSDLGTVDVLDELQIVLNEERR